MGASASTAKNTRTKRGLTQKQEKFALEFVKCGNASEAYRRSYDVKTMTAKSIQENGSRLANHVGVAARINELRLKIEQKTEITIQRIAEELARVAFADQRKVMKWGTHGVTLHDSDDLTDDAAAIVSEVSETTTKDGGSIKLKSHDKVRALELLGKHMGMFKEKLEVTTPGSAETQPTKLPADPIDASKAYKDLMG